MIIDLDLTDEDAFAAHACEGFHHLEDDGRWIDGEARIPITAGWQDDAILPEELSVQIKGFAFVHERRPVRLVEVLVDDRAVASIAYRVLAWETRRVLIALEPEERRGFTLVLRPLEPDPVNLIYGGGDTRALGLKVGSIQINRSSRALLRSIPGYNRDLGLLARTKRRRPVLLDVACGIGRNIVVARILAPSCAVVAFEGASLFAGTLDRVEQALDDIHIHRFLPAPMSGEVPVVVPLADGAFVLDAMAVAPAMAGAGAAEPGEDPSVHHDVVRFDRFEEWETGADIIVFNDTLFLPQIVTALDQVVRAFKPVILAAPGTRDAVAAYAHSLGYFGACYHAEEDTLEVMPDSYAATVFIHPARDLFEQSFFVAKQTPVAD